MLLGADWTAATYTHSVYACAYSMGMSSDEGPDAIWNEGD